MPRAHRPQPPARASRAPLDPRLLRHAPGARAHLLREGVVALVQTGAIVAFAWFAGHAIGAVVQGAPPASVVPDVALAAVAVLVRAATAWLSGSLAPAAAARVQSQLRTAALARIGEHGSPAGAADTATALGRGLAALDGWFGQFLPQLVRTVVATPIVVAALWLQDPFSGIAVLLCLPLIPVFMVLIGLATERLQREQWASTAKLARSWLDTLEGLATLRLFGRDRRAAARVDALSDQHRERTMAVLRVSFVSSMVLELAGALSVALVAVSVGIRLVEGDIALGLAFSVLILVPDAFWPVRQVGAAYHASTEGLEASRAVLDLIEAPASTVRPAPAAGPGLVVESLEVRRGERWLPPVSLRAMPGELVVLAGASGAGKSSAFAGLLGLAPARGRVGLDGAVPDASALAWAPQGAWDAVVTGTVRDNVALGRPDASGSAAGSDSAAEVDRAVEAALARAGIAVDLQARLEPATGGSLGLSGGQAQRVVLARALHRVATGAAVLLADEPTSALDADSELRVLEGLRAAADDGAIVLVASHRPAVIAAADRVVRLGAEVAA
ncbi:thiol reductant ABC exporter subunit CydD [Agrococcus sediminis]|uniref:Thiol reductant ABC exporter subunit CydD n=1 Tax=Agrococcus sediminis TaxID=2599924 RepID=A0A5M8QHR1_9MICO|nr:thiol reductant ABC exporter subunit CydD [Agrococcus sediminis]KAA6433892.1 thiol reductant ABC exporter subunit CydD [Agrococcus sediminis]